MKIILLLTYSPLGLKYLLPTLHEITPFILQSNSFLWTFLWTLVKNQLDTQLNNAMSVYNHIFSIHQLIITLIKEITTITTFSLLKFGFLKCTVLFVHVIMYLTRKAICWIKCSYFVHVRQRISSLNNKLLFIHSYCLN